MIGINDDSLASIEFRLNWEKNGVHHTDAVYAQRVNFWRDLFPVSLRRELMGAYAGDSLSQSFAPGDLVALPDERLRHSVPHGRVKGQRADGSPLTPSYGRFYPRGILRGVPGVFRGNIDPFRCTDMDDAGIRADFNHPLAGLDLRLDLQVLDVRDKFEEHGGTANDWIEQTLTGRGCSPAATGRPPSFLTARPSNGTIPATIAGFNDRPRLVQHIDDQAIATISGLYGRLIPPGGHVLDLMSSWTSHLPEDLAAASVTGLGMNAAELAANARLTSYHVHDLNQTPCLPYPDASFDAVICTVSVEYLTRPFEVFADVARVLSPGGVFVVTFSDRWFPPKAIRVWKELHPFERMGMVLELFRQSERFTSLATFSSQGRPRPANDKYADRMLFSDPVFGVWGHRLPPA